MSFGRLFFFIFGFALLEVVVLAQVAGLIGWPVTIVATVVTALLGSYLFRRQGLETWVRLNQKMQQGEMPGQEMVEGIMLLLGGALLITPGFITDAVGFALLLPASRGIMARRILAKGTLGIHCPGSGRLYLRHLYAPDAATVSAYPGSKRQPRHHRWGIAAY